MKTLAKMAMIGACIALGVARTSAQSTNSTRVTTLTFQLQADVQTSDTTVGRASVGTKQIISSLIGSNAPNISIIAKDSGSGPTFFIRQVTGHGSTAVVTDTDVSGAFTVSEALNPGVESTSSGGQSKESNIVTLALTTGTLDFVLQGYLTRSGHNNGQKISVKSLTGAGHVNENVAVFHDGGATSTSSKVEND